MTSIRIEPKPIPHQPRAKFVSHLSLYPRPQPKHLTPPQTNHAPFIEPQHTTTMPPTTKPQWPNSGARLPHPPPLAARNQRPPPARPQTTASRPRTSTTIAPCRRAQEAALNVKLRQHARERREEWKPFARIASKRDVPMSEMGKKLAAEMRGVYEVGDD